jgi:hypothetical protein
VAFGDRWLRDPARVWATELIVQTQPASAPFAGHLATLREMAGAGTGPTEGTAVRAGTGARSVATG